MIAIFATRDPVDTWLRANLWVIPFFVIIWGWMVTQGIARFSGWARLAEQYRATEPFHGEQWRFQSIRMRWMSHYNNCVTFGADAHGLSIATLFLLRPGHPPLLIPWQELEVRYQKRFLVGGYELCFLRVPGITMWVLGKVGEKILRAARERGAGLRLAPPIG